MAATAFRLYAAGKKALLNGGIDLDSDTLNAQLHKSTSNASASNLTITTLASVTVPATGGGYAAKALGGKTVSVLAGSTVTFDCSDLVWTASGSAIGSIMYLVIGESGAKPLCWSKLTTAAFTLATGNTLTIQINSSGLFTLV
jgi:hypothetical protein